MKQNDTIPTSEPMLLWLANAGDIAYNVKFACVAYARKSGRPATLVQVWPGALGGEPLVVEGVRVVESQYVLANHYLVGEGNDDNP